MKKTIVFILATTILLGFKHSKDEEGMFPLSQLSQLDLKKAGLEIEPDEIYSEKNGGLVNALVRLGGCTGSFISDNGLIITNHHCVFSSVAAASTPEENHLENGFYASKLEDEIKTSLPCRITKSYRDVSSEVLLGVDEEPNAQARQNKIRTNIKELTAKEELAHPNLKIEISEMLVGKSYTLFRYETLDDVRLVYVPPKNIGKFGGETDNWEWPRHNGDFSIVRAYVDGKPYVPAQHLEVNAGGTKEGDFAFILGYPGRTYRNQPAQFLDYQNNYVLPIISDWFDFRIKTIEDFAGDDVALQLKYSGRLASLSNVTKNFKGKMQGLQRTDVIATSYKDQAYLKEYAESNPELEEYVGLFDEADALYKRKFELATDYLYLNQLVSSTRLFNGAFNLAGMQKRLADMTKEEKATMLTTQKEDILKSFGAYKGTELEYEMDIQLFQELYYRLSNTKLVKLKSIFYATTKSAAYEDARTLYEKSKLKDASKYMALAEKDLSKFLKTKDNLISFASLVADAFIEISNETQQINAEIDQIIPRFNDLEMELNGGEFIPDANGTLRFTYGYIKGYEPEDAVVYSPFTTVTGILEKAEGSDNPDYFLQDEYLQKMKEIEPADVLKHPKENAVVVGLLYNMDTTGGNSGSPILDSKGRIVGVNFDRAYTATINDYAWNEAYSRSIGVDIRYVLYNMKYFGQADEVLSQMGVEL